MGAYRTFHKAVQKQDNEKWFKLRRVGLDWIKFFSIRVVTLEQVADASSMEVVQGSNLV